MDFSIIPEAAAAMPTVAQEMSSNFNWSYVGMLAVGALAGTMLKGVYFKATKKDCSDCRPVNAILEVLTSIVIHNKELPENEKVRLQNILTVPGK